MRKILAILTAFVFISCQKETSLEIPDNTSPTPTPAPSSLLKKFVILDTTLAAGADTLFVYTYTYDNLNRCKEIMVHDFQNLSIGYTYNYYNGTDSLISSRKLINQLSSDSIFEYFSYNAMGQIIGDSVLGYHGSWLAVFTYKYQIAGNIITSDIMVNSQPLMKGKYVITKDNAGNITREKDSSFNYTAGLYIYNDNTDIVTTYDTYNNPFYKLYPRRLVELEYELAAVDDVPFYQFLQKRNIKTKKWTTLPVTSGLQDTDETYQYTYNVNNLPVTVVYKELLLNEVNKGLFFY